VEVPLTPGVPFTDRIRSIKSAVEHVRNPIESAIPFSTNLYYSQVVDLRKLEDIDAVLHLNAKKTGTHKIQIVEAGKKCSGEIMDTVARIVDEHFNALDVSRVDTCADVIDGPHVRWIAQSVRARSSQWQSQFGSVGLRDDQNHRMQWSEMGRREVGTMYLGKRPNCFRVYDKLAERRQAWTRERRRHERLASNIVADATINGSSHNHTSSVTYKEWRRGIEKQVTESGRNYFPFPGFEQWFADQCRGPQSNILEMPNTLTRVERQMGAGRIPDRLNSFKKIFSKQALEFNPFERLDLSPFDVKKVLEFSANGQILYRCSPGEKCYQCRHPHSADDGCGHVAHLGYCDCPFTRSSGEICNGCSHVHKGEVRCDVALTDVCECEGVSYSVVEYAAGFQFKQWLEEGMSYQQLYALWNRKRHGKKLAQKYAPFIAAANPEDAVTISSKELYENYRDSLSRQMAA
jgi:hypothetical protein